MDGNFVEKIKELADKYSAAQDIAVELVEGAVKVSCDKGKYCFFYDFDRKFEYEGFVNVPMFHWQAQRRYIELRGLLDRKMITPALAVRIHHIVPHGEFTHTLKDILVFETDLFEFVTRSKVNRVFADFSGEVYTNCIMSSESNVKVSMEVGFSPDGSQPVLLHEVVARTGVASDLPVDTQMVQYPIYVLKGGETEVYNEIDFELYGMNNTQADCSRFMIWALSDINRIKTVCVDYQHVEKVYEAAMISSKSLQYTPVEG